MGIESDQLVYDYLSRVGDLAQQRQLPSGTRMRLVSDLRNRIDSSRSKAVVDSPAAVRRILARLGTPEEVVEAAGGAPGDVSAQASAPTAAVPTQREGDGTSKRLRRMVPRPRRAAPQTPQIPEAAETPEAPEAPKEAEPQGPWASPPHLAGSDELGPSGSEPDWWRVDSSPFGLADSVPGFVGGVEIPEILKPPPSPDDADRPRDLLRKEGEREEGEEGDEEGEGVEEGEEGRGRRWIPRLPGGSGAGLGNPLLVLAAALLTVGAVLDNWLALGGGWLIAYASRRLTRTEVKLAVMGLPGLVAAAGITWLWGRSDGRWGDPIKDGHMSDAMAETWPWVVRGAAVASALFLLWRSQRQRP
ncbi:hypothetical protein AB0B50_39390 [Streptomyces sp. NPDC041068]|uniref:hypothetical protein n=1 Tax=Streptomyces sp. NPDC041068 TaxID=3155130 RepID=UPI00340A8AA7